MDNLGVKWPVRQMSVANEYMFNYTFETGAGKKTLILCLILMKFNVNTLYSCCYWL